MHRAIQHILLTVLTLAPLSALAAPATQAPPATPAQQAETEAKRFPSPEDAARALVEAARSNDTNQLAAVFGNRHAELLSSGDEVEDRNNREAFVAMAGEKMGVEKVSDTQATLHVGQADWAFPIPLIKTGEGWQFDADQGREEMLNRRIGRNELSALGVMNGYVEAQFEYANADWDGDGVVEYAQKIRSEPGTFNGLFWEAGPGEPPSPLGPLIAQARAEGYSGKASADKPSPYHGYYYKILTRQGSQAPGGRYNYVINGHMIAGFGLVAFPAEYGSSGIMTFIVNHQGRIYQKDLGPKTREIAAAMKEFNPDPSWKRVEPGK